jgi:hypothetical protein
VNTKETPSSGSSARTAILVLLLAVLGVGAAYDFLYARPKAEYMHNVIFTFCDGVGSGNKIYTPNDIHKLLGAIFTAEDADVRVVKPTKVTAEKAGYMVETYSVMAGSVFRSYDIHVIYSSPDPEAAKAGKGKANFNTVVKGDYPDKSLMPESKSSKGDNTPIPPPPGPASGGGGGGGGGNRQRPSGEAADKPEEGKKVEQKKDEAKPEGEAKAEDKPAEPKTEEPKTEEPKSDEPKAEEKPAGDAPVEEKKPGEDKPAEPPVSEPPAGEPKN